MGINRSLSTSTSPSSSNFDENEMYSANLSLYQLNHNPLGSSSKQNTSTEHDSALLADERLKNIEPKMVQFITNEVRGLSPFLDHGYWEASGMG